MPLTEAELAGLLIIAKQAPETFAAMMQNKTLAKQYQRCMALKQEQESRDHDS